MVKHIANINNNIVSIDLNGIVTSPGIKTAIIEHTTNGTGNAGQYITADGTGGWSWSTPTSTVSELDDLTDGKTFGTSHFIGTSAGINATTGSSSNVGFGYQVMTSLTQAANNTAVGYQALSTNTNSGNNNTAIGFKSLLFNVSGANNCGLGYGTLQNNNSGIDNTMIGMNAGLANQTGNYNVAIGSQNLRSNLSGSFNVAIGHNALRYANSTNYNVAVGFNTLSYNNGEHTICIGQNSLDDSTYTNIDNSVYIGNNISPSGNNADNEIVIGYSATGSGNNTITLGNNSITELYVPGLQSSANNGDVLTFDGTKINLSALPANSGTVVEPFTISSVGGLFTMTDFTGYYSMFYTYIDVEFSRISLYTMSDTSGASGTVVAGVFSDLSFTPNTSLSQAITTFTNINGVTELIVDFSTIQLVPHTKYWIGISVQITNAGTLYLAKSTLGSTDNFFALSEAATFNGTTLSSPGSPSPSSFNFYYRLHRPNAPGGILSNSTTVPTAIEVAHAEGQYHSSTTNITQYSPDYTKIKFRTTGYYASNNYTLAVFNDNITVLSDGLYSISFTGTTRLNASNARTTTSIALFINGVELVSSIVHTYNRLEPQSDDSASYTHVGYYTSGTTFDYRICLDDGPGPILIKDNGNHLTIMKLSN